MRRMLAVLALLALLLSAAAAEGVRMPDVGPLLGVEGELYSDKDGYRTYRYVVEMTLDEAAEIIVDYTEALRELGFDAKSVKVSSEPSIVRCMRYTMNGAMAEFALIVAGGAESIVNGGEGEFWFALAVPDEIPFEPGEGTSLLVEGGTRCISCGGSGRCSYCGGSGRYDYGDGYEDCAACDGYGTCDVCDGEGSY